MEDTKHKRKSLAITTTLLVALLFLMFYMGHSYPDPPVENRITVNFGPMGHGSGNKQPAERVQTAPRPKQVKPREATPAKPEERIEDVLTNDEEETPVIPPEKRPTPKETPKTAPRKEEEPVEEPKKPLKEKMEDILTHKEEETPKAVPKKEEKPVWNPKDRASVEGLKKGPKFTTAILSGIPDGPGNDANAAGSEGKDSVNVAGDKGEPGEQTYYCSCGMAYVFYNWREKGEYLGLSSPQEVVAGYCMHRRLLKN